MTDEEGISTNSVLRPQKTIKTIINHIRNVFLFIFSSVKSFTLLGTHKNRSVRMNLGQNSVMAQFGGGGALGPKTQKFGPF